MPARGKVAKRPSRQEVQLQSRRRGKEVARDEEEGRGCLRATLAFAARCWQRLRQASFWRRRLCPRKEPRPSLLPPESPKKAPAAQQQGQSKARRTARAAGREESPEPGPPSLSRLAQLLFLGSQPKEACEPALLAYVKAFQARAESGGLGWEKKTLTLLRGPPGLGKSYFAEKRLREAAISRQAVEDCGEMRAMKAAVRLAHVCSTDDFFTSIAKDGGEMYHYSPKRLTEFHTRNQERVKLAMKLQLTPLFVDNTNLAWWEMRPYLELAEDAGYSVEVVEPQALSPKWDDLAFLEGRNSMRKAIGKCLDRATLRRMVLRYEPLPAGKEGLRLLRGASKASALFCGVDVHPAMQQGRLAELWKALEAAFEGKGGVEGAQLKLQRYDVPGNLHVTTFFKTEFHGGVMADAVMKTGTEVSVQVEAVAFAAGYLACAVVTRMEPAPVAPRGKRMHVTLASREPWAPKHSNTLLEAMLPGGECPASSSEEEGQPDLTLQPAPPLDLAALWPSLGQPGLNDSVRAFQGLRLEGLPAGTMAYLVRLPRPMVLKGKRYVHWER